MKEVNNNAEGLNEVEFQIFKTFEKIKDDYSSLPKEKQSGHWITNEIKQRIGDIGYSLNYEVASSIHDGAWLYDLVWYKNNEKGYLETVSLVLESEISDRNPIGIKYDFEKLLISNSDYKVMICMGCGNSGFPKNINELLPLFENSVQSYTKLKKDVRILVLVWEDYMTGEIFPHLIIKK